MLGNWRCRFGFRVGPRQRDMGKKEGELILQGRVSRSQAPGGISEWEVIADEDGAGWGSSKDGVSQGGHTGYPAPEPAVDRTEVEWPQEMRGITHVTQEPGALKELPGNRTGPHCTPAWPQILGLSVPN